MIANVPRAGRAFAGLARYLVEGRAGRPASKGRVAWTKAFNLMTDDAVMAAKIMTATARLSKRCERPVYHLIVSWHVDERPLRAQMETVATATLGDLGLAGHQVLIVAHKDRTNPHMHLVINRVHPETGVAWTASHDYRRIERSVFRQAKALGFRAVPGRHNGPDAGPRQESRRRAPTKGAVHLSRKRRLAAAPVPAPAQQTEPEPQA
ncbi:MAG: relaxase/mobilization nuclease domain-containing protein [Hyphomicrobiaceae bacterium]